VTDAWVLNASPLIVLSRIQHEHLFLELASQIIVPLAVAKEIDAGPEDDSARLLLATGRLPVVEAPLASEELLAWDLGVGETAVLAFGLANPTWTVILDDGAARRCARSFSIPLKGTLGVVLLARQRGLIPSAATVLRELSASGFRLDDAVVDEALRKTVGETWR
jgi:predicted nucleic acid-binding protein